MDKKDSQPAAIIPKKSQKTLFDYFRNGGGNADQNQASEIPCPACNDMVLETKINWHLDQLCMSRIKKPSHTKKKCTKQLKTVDVDVIVLDSDEQESGDDSGDLHDGKKRENSDSDMEVYISPSAIETQLVAGSQDQSIGNNNLGVSGDTDVLNMLENDWLSDCSLSPATSPNKFSKSNKPLACGEEVNLCGGGSYGSPQTSVVKSFVESQSEVENLKYCSGSHDKSSSNIATDSLNCNIDKECVLLKASQEYSTGNDSTGNNRNRESLQPQSCALNQSVQKNLGTDVNGSETSNSDWYSPLNSPAVVYPTRSPSLTPVKIDKPQGLEEKALDNICGTGICTNTENNLQLSPTVTGFLQQVRDDSVSNCEKTDPFDALKSSSASNSRTPNTSSSPVKPMSRTPRRSLQALKNSQCLQNSHIPSRFVHVRRSLYKSPTKSDINLNKEVNDPSEPDLGQIKSTSEDLQLAYTGVEKSDFMKKDPASYRDRRGYYLDNFLLILDAVEADVENMELFITEEKDIMKTFRGLSLPAQKLYVRMFQRKAKWNRVSKIEYRDICDKEDTSLFTKELAYADFMISESQLTNLDEALNLLTSAEVLQLCKELKVQTARKKEDMVKTLLKNNRQQQTILSAFGKKTDENSVIMKKALEFLGQCCLINKDVRQVFMRVLMLYSLPSFDEDMDSGQQSQLTTLLMTSLGKMVFPKFDVIKKHRIFQSREDLLRYETCHQIYTDVMEKMESQKWTETLITCREAEAMYSDFCKDEKIMLHEKSMPSFVRRFSAISLLVYILTCRVEVLERLRNYKVAVEKLHDLLGQKTHLQDYRGRWYDRLAVNYEQHLKNPKKAVKVIAEALKDPEVRVGHRLSLTVRGLRMLASPRYKALVPSLEKLPLEMPAEAPKVVIKGCSVTSSASGYKRMFIYEGEADCAVDRNVMMCSVEELVIQHYKKQGYSEGLHHEGTTVRTLFGLLFWNIIYASVNDAFWSHHQAVPLDLDSPHFYRSRKDMIDNRLRQIREWSEDDLEKELEDVWSENYGTVSIVHWDILKSLQQVQGLILSLGLKLVANICERIAMDHRFTRSGFPDLIVWDPEGKRSRIVEVKGPNDRLSPKQMLWLEYLIGKGAQAEVCHVEAVGTKRNKRQSLKVKSTKKEITKQKDAAASQPSRRRRTRKNVEDSEEGDGKESENSDDSTFESPARVKQKKKIVEKQGKVHGREDDDTSSRKRYRKNKHVTEKDLVSGNHNFTSESPNKKKRKITTETKNTKPEDEATTSNGLSEKSSKTTVKSVASAEVEEMNLGRSAKKDDNVVGVTRNRRTRRNYLKSFDQ